MWSWLQVTFRSRYVTFLEREVERMRRENSALRDTILGFAGVGPISAPASATPNPVRKLPVPQRRDSMQQRLRRMEIDTSRVVSEEQKKLVEAFKSLGRKEAT